MQLVGKCPPSATALRAADERGFDAVELHLEPEHLDSAEETITTVRNAPVEVASVHTPHVTPQSEAYFSKADSLGHEFDARLVIHSQYLQHTHIDDLEAIDFDAPYGYENNPGASAYHLRNLIVDRGHDLVLDTAHLYMAEPRFQEAFERLLREYASRIPVVHLTDSTLVEDGLPFGRGEMDIRSALATLERHPVDTVVLEVMPEHQADALAVAASALNETEPHR